jgi:hypothetical protein
MHGPVTPGASERAPGARPRFKRRKRRGSSMGCRHLPSTASRLNDAGFCRGGNFTKSAIADAITACIMYNWGT